MSRLSITWCSTCEGVRGMRAHAGGEGLARAFACGRQRRGGGTCPALRAEDPGSNRGVVEAYKESKIRIENGQGEGLIVKVGGKYDVVEQGEENVEWKLVDGTQKEVDG